MDKTLASCFLEKQRLPLLVVVTYGFIVANTVADAVVDPNVVGLGWFEVFHRRLPGGF